MFSQAVYRISIGLILTFIFSFSLPALGDDTQVYAEQVENLKKTVALQKCRKTRNKPSPPTLPRNFSWTGRYVVPDIVDPRTGELGIDVPFTWCGNDGDVQMIAGGENYPIYFTNFIYQNYLYTYTYKWPGLQPEFLPPLESCAPLFKFTLADLNALLATATYVGKATLENGQKVNHFRLPIVTPPTQPPGFYLRLPLILGDFFVDRNNPKKFWQVLHFGIQNLYAPHLDEWIFIHKFKKCPGEIILPPCV
ncbi:MAG: hypothetical protein Q8K60_01140 [Parachlamydiaceae bacterium]|nr:hypothetical protein [Parachlamydiaceae bacterium]